ncbi:MAG: OmpH family outer membrane protein [Janthinobacterium lividum]
MTYGARFVLLGLLLSLSTLRPAWAQKFGYVDTDFIMSKMPEYAQAQVELNKLSDTWQKEIEAQKKDLDQLYRNYQSEEIVLTEVMKKKRQDEIQRRKKDVEDYETQRFGYEGQLFKKRGELNKPVQDKIVDAIEKVVKARKLDVIFDRNGEPTILFASPTYDYTEYVMEELGLGSPEANRPTKGPVKTVTPLPTPSGGNTAPGLRQKNTSASPDAGEMLKRSGAGDVEKKQ